MKVGDLVLWRHPHDRRMRELGIVIELGDTNDRHGEINVLDLCQERFGDVGWWDAGDWEVISERR